MIDHLLIFCIGKLLTWATDNKDEERQEPRSHRNFIITDVSLREFTFKSVRIVFSCHLIVVQWDLAMKAYIHCSIKSHYFSAETIIANMNNTFQISSVNILHSLNFTFYRDTTVYHEELSYRRFDVASLGDVFAVFLVGHTNPLFGDHRYKCWWVLKVSWRPSQIWRTQTSEDEEKTTSIFVYVLRM